MFIKFAMSCVEILQQFSVNVENSYFTLEIKQKILSIYGDTIISIFLDLPQNYE